MEVQLRHHSPQVDLAVLEAEDKGNGGDVGGLPLKCSGGSKLPDAAHPNFGRNPLELGGTLTPKGRRGLKGGGCPMKGGWTGTPSPLLDHFFDGPSLLRLVFDGFRSWHHGGGGEKCFAGIKGRKEEDGVQSALSPYL